MRAFRRSHRLAGCLSSCSFLALSFVAGPADAASVVSSADARDLADVVHSLDRRGTLRIEGLPLEGETDLVGLDLVRFDAVMPGARFVLQTDDGPRAAKPPVPTYLRGTVDGQPGAVVVLSVRSSGEIRGVVSSSEGTWVLARNEGSGRKLRSGRVDLSAATATRKFDCEVLENPNPRRPPAPPPVIERSQRLAIAYTASIGVELDYDYYLTFAPDTDAAFLYALDLIAYTGVLGEAELGMNTLVPFIQLWTTSADPYANGSARLQQVRDRWNTPGSDFCGGTDCTTIARSTVIVLSSAGNGGRAYLPGICDSYHFPTDGYAYAYAGAIDGNFDVHSSDVVWDIVVTTHELGHNWGSHHTHCYEPAVDECYGGETGCYEGPGLLPAGCPGGGMGCGTIMSYCHLLFGGINNMTLTYGVGHPYGTDPDRVPNAMIAQLTSEYAAAPSCLEPVSGLTELSITKAGSGQGTVTTSPSGLDCGTACRAYFNGDTVVTLVATPSTFSDLVGWSGDPDCADGSVTLSNATSCIATFDGNCGASKEDCDDNNPCTRDSCPGPADEHCENAAAPIDESACFLAGSAKLQIKNSPSAASDKLVWKFSKGEAFEQADLGDPSQATMYNLCVYDSTASTWAPAPSLDVAASSFWKSKDPKGWNYADSAARSDGVKKLQLKTGVDGKSKVQLTALGATLPLPVAFSGTELFDQDPSVVVQLISDEGECWMSTFTPAGTNRNTPELFRAEAP